MISYLSAANDLPVVRCANRIFVELRRIARHRLLICFMVMAFTMVARLALLPRKPIPKPFVSDEFSYLLGAETFASGRWTNPSHPMWPHFETFHVLMRPTYMSKYPPGQALFLAIGRKLLGHPWFGVWISFGLFAGAVCWMLQNWVPPVYALIGTAISLARISITGYWMNSYWGGAVAAFAGCLVLGALPRLVRRNARAGDSAIFSLGLFLLAITRPYEGLAVVAGTGVALLFWRMRGHLGLADLFSARSLIPFFLVFGIGAMVNGYYNYRVTGSPWVMPYRIYFQQYQIASPWLIFGEQRAPEYRHAEIENTWKELDRQEYREEKAHPLQNVRNTYDIFSFYFGSLYLFPIAIGLLVSCSRRYWTAAGIVACLWFALLIESAKFPHYLAAGAGLFPVMVVYGLRYLRIIGREYGALLVLILAALICIQGKASDRGRPWETRPPGLLSPRMIVMSEVIKAGSNHLIFVRYAPNHVDKSTECVYNSANIDASQIVWAQDMGEEKNRELIDYFHGNRKVWLFQPDINPSEVVPYEPLSHTMATNDGSGISPRPSRWTP
jgi:hypothetical protein